MLKPTREYETPEELELLNTIFKDKPQSWLDTRRFIHSHPLKALSMFEQLAAKDPKFLDVIHDWELWMRPEQYLTWEKSIVLMNLGRGSGKNKAASAFVVDEAKRNPGMRISIWAQSFKTLKDNNWAGESGILKAVHPELLSKCNFNKSSLSLTFPNGSVISSVSVESYESSRGQNNSLIVLDEVCAYSYAEEAVEAAFLTLRLGENPRMLITTTPKPIKAIKDLAKDSSVQVMTGTTYQNYFLPPIYIETLEKKLTERMRRQELLAEILEDNLFAMFKISDISECRVPEEKFDYENLRDIVIGVDPAVTSNEKSDLTGIAVCGLGYDGEYYVLEDASMEKASPEEWSAEVIKLYKKYNKYSAAVKIVAESNQGGDLLKSVMMNAARKHPNAGLPPVQMVRATKGKELRAEPISVLYEQNIVHHVGTFNDLEVQMTDYNPTDKSAKSPDRLDALVWAITALSKGFVGDISAGYGGIKKDPSNPFKKPVNPYCGYR